MLKHLSPPLLILVALLSIMLPVVTHGHAIDPDGRIEATYLQKLPQVLTATRLEQPLNEAPAAVTIIDREMIKASGARTIPDLFRLVPGFVVGWMNGNRAVVSYHGMSDDLPRRMQILVDGRSEYQPSLGGPNWNDLPVSIADIARIEVVRGPNAAGYGSNSFQAVINIITLHAAETHGVSARLQRGNNGISDVFARAGGKLGNTDLRLSFALSEDDGFKTNKQFRHDDYYRIPTLSFRSDSRLTRNDNLMINAGYSGGARGEIMSLTSDTHYAEHLDRHFGQMRWQHSRDNGELFSVQGMFNVVDVDAAVSTTVNLPPLPSQVFSSNLGYRGQRYDLEFQHTLPVNNALRVVWGLGERLDMLQSARWLNSTDTYTTRVHRLFGNGEYRITDQWLLNAGIMWERHELAGTTASPRAALNYLLAPGHTLRLSVSRGYRAPFIVEQFGLSKTTLSWSTPAYTVNDVYAIAAGNARPETIRAFEVGYLGQTTSIPLQIEARLYQEDIDHILTPVTTKPCPLTDNYNNRCLVIQNADSARIRGLEGQLRYNFSKHSWVLLNYALSRISSTDTDKDYQYSRSMPSHSGSIMAVHRLPADIQASAIYYWSDEMTWMGWDNRRSLPSSERLDLRLAKTYDHMKQRFELAFVVQNAFGDYQEFNNTNYFGKRYLFSVAMDYN